MIIVNNEELLRKPCEPVKPEEVGELIALLEKELNYANLLGKGGIGLACSQIGIYKQCAIVRINKDLNINLVNAKIDKGYDPIMFKDEGCLSFPGRVENTTRFQEVVISNNLEFPNSLIATGLMAVACQHELDHCNSVLFMDHKIKATPKIKIGPNDPCYCGSKIKYKKCKCH